MAQLVYPSGVKFALFLLGAASALSLTACTQTTLENRRDLYFPQPVNGPYTRMLHEGIPSVEKTTVTTTTTTVSVSGDGKTVIPPR